MFFVTKHFRRCEVMLILLLLYFSPLPRTQTACTYRYSLMLDCWFENPDHRPTFNHLSAQISEILNQSASSRTSSGGSYTRVYTNSIGDYYDLLPSENYSELYSYVVPDQDRYPYVPPYVSLWEYELSGLHSCGQCQSVFSRCRSPLSVEANPVPGHNCL